MDYSEFNKFWDLYNPDEIRFPCRRAATFREWQKKSPSVRKAMMEAVEKANGGLRWKNPYFFVSDFAKPEPSFLSGPEQNACFRQGIPLVQVRYNDRYLICTRQTMQEFGLEYVREWLPVE